MLFHHKRKAPPMTIIEIRPFRNGWKCFEAAGVCCTVGGMKPYSLVVVMIITAAACASSFAQDKTSLQANASVAGILQGSAGKSVELHLRSGEKMVGKVA
jgi:hypothetical protein